ncbi:hypothetical protein T03_9487, partial [Trichinella britovi]
MKCEHRREEGKNVDVEFSAHFILCTVRHRWKLCPPVEPPVPPRMGFPQPLTGMV